MGAKRRTPVLWPRMKVRGARRRALVAMRLTRLVIIPYAMPFKQSDGSVRFKAVSKPMQGAMRLEYRTTHDGYGRSVAVKR